MINFYEATLKKSAPSEAFQMLKDLDKNVYPGIYKEITEDYFSKLKMIYPDFIDVDMCLVLLNKFSNEFISTNSPEEIILITNQVMNELPLTYTLRQQSAMLAWIQIMLHDYYLASGILSAVHMAYILDTTDLVEYRENADFIPQMTLSYNKSILESVNTIKKIAIDKVNLHSKVNNL